MTITKEFQVRGGGIVEVTIRHICMGTVLEYLDGCEAILRDGLNIQEHQTHVARTIHEYSFFEHFGSSSSLSVAAGGDLALMEILEAKIDRFRELADRLECETDVSS